MRFLLALLLFLVGTADAQPAYLTAGDAAVVSGIIGYPEHMAGRKTASGDRYDPHDLTVAHASLPFGTRLELIVPSTGRSAMVTVNDRGSLLGGTDLVASAATMSRLGLSRDDRGRVRVKVWDETAPPRARATGRQAASRPAPTAAPPRPAPIPKPEPQTAAPKGFAVQLGSFSQRGVAEEVAQTLDGSWIESARVEGRPVYRVYYGRFQDRREAEAWQARLQGLGMTGYVRTLR